MPPDHVDINHSRRCNTLLWISYALNKEFGTLVGGKSSIRNEDITAKFPSEISNSPSAASVTLQICSARLTATILTGKMLNPEKGDSIDHDQLQVYMVRIDFEAVFSRIHKPYERSRYCRSTFDPSFSNDFQNFDIRTSKVASRLVLSYHHVSNAT